MPVELAALTQGDFIPVIELLSEMVWIGDSEGRCVYLNKALREFWGVDISDLPRFTWSSTLLEADAEALFLVFKKAMSNRVPFTVQARYRRADGAIRVLETMAKPRFAPNGEFLGMVGINTDISDR
jgi:PAS domain S-box-containing protein